MSRSVITGHTLRNRIYNEKIPDDCMIQDIHKEHVKAMISASRHDGWNEIGFYLTYI